jgi:hypothetical protein
MCKWWLDRCQSGFLAAQLAYMIKKLKFKFGYPICLFFGNVRMIGATYEAVDIET